MKNLIIMATLIVCIQQAAIGAPPSGTTATTNPAPTNFVQVLGQSTITVDAGSGRIIQLATGAATVFAAEPKIAEVRPASATSLFIFGVAPGRTTVAALDAAGKPIAQYNVVVRPSSYGASEAEATVARVLPGTSVHVETLQNGLTITGTVKTAADADRVMQIVRGYAPAGQAVDNRLSVTGAVQVNLRVRIAEMSRNLIRQLGVNWANLVELGKYAQIGLFTNNPLVNLTRTPNQFIGNYNFPTPGHIVDINGLIDTLSQDELIHVLAQPNLTAMSGEAASFLVGGEFPIPVAQQNNEVTIEFKQYGVSLAFVPTVGSDGQIAMKVRTEVSQLTNQGAVQLSAGNSTIQVPALTVRRAETAVELGSGESFAIAGLLQDAVNVTGNGLPIMGDVPILGALFRSDNFQRNETELVIVVTPYVVRPVANPAMLQLPTDGYRPPSDLERILLLRRPVILNRSRRPETLQGGRVVTITGARGGVGASTIAANLAWHLGKRANRHTVLVDADLHRGTCALLLNAKSGAGLRTALETPQRIDELFIERSAQPVTERLHVLSGEENLTDQISYEPGAAGRLIETLRRRYNFIVIDAPFSGLELHRDLLMLGHQRILVLEPTLAGVRDALRLLALPNGPLQVHRGLLLLNRLGRPGMLTRQQTEDALKAKVDIAIPDLPRLVEDAANIGEPAALNSRFYKGIIALAGQATAAFPIEGSPESPRATMKRGWRRLWPLRA
jgi:pilus assembly protein CpaC